MNYNRLIRLAAASAVSMAALTGAAHASDMPSQEELWQMIKLQQQQIETLQNKLTTTDKKVDKTATIAKEANTKALAAAAPAAGGSAYSPYGGGSGAPGWWQRTSLGGYGEMHYNGSKEGDDQIDFHRFVLFVNHEFNDRIRLFSELELEHSLSGDGKPGEVELEQAFLEFDITDYTQARAGLFLLPIGILNEKHEPNTFFGVERNPVENKIIPTTWWEGGVAVNTVLAEGLRADVAVHSGLKVDPTSFAIRGGRQKVAEADADNGAATARLRYTGIPGVELASSVQYQSDVTQSEAGNDDASAWLWSAHADIQRGGYGLRALYARWDIDGAGAKALGADEQYGWYVEPSYRFNISDEVGDLGVFARYNMYDNTANSASNTEVTQLDVGTNFWPHPNVVLKADVAFVDNEGTNVEDEIYNLGVGFSF